jgi:hypothetical protein
MAMDVPNVTPRILCNFNGLPDGRESDNQAGMVENNQIASNAPP